VADRRPVSLLFALAFLAAAQAISFSVDRRGLPAFTRPVLEEFALMDAFSAMAGLRRLGSDLAFIQALQYYATPEERGGETDEHGHAVHDVGEGLADTQPQVRQPFFPRLLDHMSRVASLDPYFHYAYLFGAGALAFNLNRDDEALKLLDQGARIDPNFWRFRLYAGAIAFRKSNEMDKAIVLLEEAIRYPDCPSPVMNILANLYKKKKQYGEAARIYRHMLENSRDENYRQLARDKLTEIRRRGG
jgi:tetratricopeptide (TPR) repeat protein